NRPGHRAGKVVGCVVPLDRPEIDAADALGAGEHEALEDYRLVEVGVADVATGIDPTVVVDDLCRGLTGRHDGEQSGERSNELTHLCVALLRGEDASM